MAKVAARKAGSMKALRANLAKSNVAFIKSVPEDDFLNVRFLQEPEDWIGWDEVWDSDMRQYYPMPAGFERDEKVHNVTARYLACVVDLSSDQVVPLKLPRDLANRLVARYDRYGTLLDRDYELTRQGSGFDTTYDVTPEAPSRKKLDKYEVLDLEKVLQDAFDSVFGGDEEEEEEEEPRRPAKKQPQRKPRSRQPEPEEEDDEEDDDFDDEDEDLDEDDFEDWDDEDEDEDEDDEDEDDVFEYEEADLEDLTITELRGIAKGFGIKTTKMTKDDLIMGIMDAQDEAFDN